MVGSAITGALVMGFGSTSRAPHGSIWVVGLIGKPLLYILAILIGTRGHRGRGDHPQDDRPQAGRGHRAAASRQATAAS